MIDAHRLAERRSLAAHAEIARRVRDDPALVEQARARVAAWLEDESVHAEYARAWQALLSLPLPDLTSALVEDTQAARALRQSSPFAGVLSARERWQLWRDVKREL